MQPDRIATQIRVQAYNLFNHPQFGNLSNTNIDNGVLSINTTRFRSARELRRICRWCREPVTARTNADSLWE